MILRCPSCTVRSWRKDDGPSLVRHANYREIWLNVRDCFPHPYTDDAASEWLEFATSEKPETNYAITIDDQVVGAIGFEIKDDVNRFSAEVGYWLGKDLWGKGIATEALMAVSEHAFRSFALIRLFALPFADNKASCRVLEKAGFRKEARLRNNAVKDGIVKDQFVYALFNGV